MKALHASEEAMQKEHTKSYRDLITALGSARKSLTDLDQEWADYRSQWAAYMDSVSKMWIEQAESFEKGEDVFAQKRKDRRRREDSWLAREAQRYPSEDYEDGTGAWHRQRRGRSGDGRGRAHGRKGGHRGTGPPSVHENSDDYSGQGAQGVHRGQSATEAEVTLCTSWWWRGRRRLPDPRAQVEGCKEDTGGCLAPILLASTEVAVGSEEPWQRGAEHKKFRCLCWMPVVDAVELDGSVSSDIIRLEDPYVSKVASVVKSKSELRAWQQTISSYHDYKSVWRAQMEALWLRSSLLCPSVHAEFCDDSQGWHVSADVTACRSMKERGVGPLSSHVPDLWCSSLGLISTSIYDENSSVNSTDEEDNSASGTPASDLHIVPVPDSKSTCPVPLLVLRPNQELTVDFDDIVPTARGNIIPPPEWRNKPIYRTAVGAGVAVRDGGGRLVVSFRSWLVIHGEARDRSHRDFSMRPQLLVHLSETARKVWRDRISRTVHVWVHLVRPTPMNDPADPPHHRFVHLILEVQRPVLCWHQPTLIVSREITAEGVSPPLWFPTLLPNQFNTQDVWEEIQRPCAQHQLLVPMAGRARRWLNPYHTRDSVPGLFIPTWHDRRLPLMSEQPYAEGQSLLQISARSLDFHVYPSVSEDEEEAEEADALHL